MLAVCALGMACPHAVVVSVTTTALLLLLLLSVLQVFSVRYRQQIEAAIQEHERRSRAGSDASASSEGAASGTTEHEGDTSVKQAAEALAASLVAANQWLNALSLKPTEKHGSHRSVFYGIFVE